MYSVSLKNCRSSRAFVAARSAAKRDRRASRRAARLTAVMQAPAPAV